MSLEALLVSRDADAVGVLRTVMRHLGVASEVYVELEPAVERLAQGEASAIVVDYDVEHAAGLLRIVRQNYAGSCVAMAMVKGLASIQAAYDMGANFVLIKPVTPEAATRGLGEVIALVKGMLYRPARLVVPSLAYVSLEDTRDPAIILDLSEGGMAIQALQQVEASGALRLNFDLPGSLDTMNVKADIVWADSSGRAGLRFVDLSEDELLRLRDWVRISRASLQAAARLSVIKSNDLLLVPPLPPAVPAASESEPRPATAAVAQRIFSALVDAGVVLLASAVFLVAFLVLARQLPASRWALPVALLVPFLFWGLYLYLFLAHPGGTPGMQMAEKGTAAEPPQMFDWVPPSPLVSVSSRVLTWLEAHCAGQVHAPEGISTLASRLRALSAKSARPEDGPLWR